MSRFSMYVSDFHSLRSLAMPMARLRRTQCLVCGAKKQTHSMNIGAFALP